MAITIDKDILVLSNCYAVVLWLFYLFFVMILIGMTYTAFVHPQATHNFWVWQTALLVFSPLVVSLLFRLAGQQRIVKARFDRNRKHVFVREYGLLGSEKAEYHFEQIFRLEYLSTENDGYFYTAYVLFSDGRKIPIAQGNYDSGVREALVPLKEFLQQALPDLEVKELSE